MKKTSRRFSVIYADPPWFYSNQMSNRSALGGSSYDKMRLPDLGDLDIQLISEKDCAMFMWATYPKLKEALWLMDAWGFDYRTVAFTWVKTNRKSKGIYSGMGHWTNGNAEICLFGKKGAPKRVAKNVKQIVIYPVGKHSKKPPIVRDRIVKLMGDVPRVELFARDRANGWDVWGNQVKSTITVRSRV